MLKGTQRKVIMLKDTKSGIFDEAYFILKNSGIDPSLSRTDMIKEADRIISASLIAPKPPERKKTRESSFLLCFYFGALCGILFSLVSAIIILT